MQTGRHYIRNAKAIAFSRISLTAALLLSITVSLAGCGWNPFAQPRQSPLHTPTVEVDNESTDTVTVYFSRGKGAGGSVDNVSRPLPEADRLEPIRVAVNELLKGPTAEEKKQGFYSEIPKGTKLLGVSRHDGIMTVDLSRAFTTGGGSTSVTQRVEELKQTVYAVDRKNQLKVVVEGKPLEILSGEGLEMPDTLKRTAQ